MCTTIHEFMVVNVVAPVHFMYHGHYSVVIYDSQLTKHIFSSLSQIPVSIQSLVCHNFAQVRWLLMTVNDCMLTAAIASKLTFVQLTCHTTELCPEYITGGWRSDTQQSLYF